MTGPHDSIIGMEREPSLARFLNGMPSRFEPATGNPRLNGVVVDGRRQDRDAPRAITRISYSERELDELGRRPRGSARAVTRMSSCFDLPFEEPDPEPRSRARARRREPEPPRRAASSPSPS